MNREQRSREGEGIRMNVKVSHRDFPALTEEIARLPKGPRRTHRLALLATLGLVWERAVADWTGRLPGVVSSSAPVSSLAGAATTQYQSRLDASQVAALFHADVGS